MAVTRIWDADNDVWHVVGPGPTLDAAQGILGQAQVITGQGPITTITDLTGLSVTVDLPAGRLIKISGQSQVSLAASTAGHGHIREGSTILGRWGRTVLGTTGLTLFWSGFTLIAPTMGIHTYKLSIEATAGSVTTQSSADTPVFLLVEDVGAA